MIPPHDIPALSASNTHVDRDVEAVRPGVDGHYTNNNFLPTWIEATTVTPVDVARVSLTLLDNLVSYPTAFALQYHDGIAWVELAQWTYTTATPTAGPHVFHAVP